MGHLNRWLRINWRIVRIFSPWRKGCCLGRSNKISQMRNNNKVLVRIWSLLKKNKPKDDNKIWLDLSSKSIKKSLKQRKNKNHNSHNKSLSNYPLHLNHNLTIPKNLPLLSKITTIKTKLLLWKNNNTKYKTILH